MRRCPISVFKVFISFQGEPGYAAVQMVNLLEEGEPIIAVIGPTSSYSVTMTGQIAPFYNVIEVTLS